MSVRRLGVLVRQLPETSRLATALNGGLRPMTSTDELLADLWVAWVRLLSEKGSLPDDFDHPRRVKLRAKEKAKQTEDLRGEFRRRQRKYGLTS